MAPLRLGLRDRGGEDLPAAVLFPADSSLTTVACPLTSANLGPGFDALGLALAVENRFTIEARERFSIEVTGPGAERIPRDPAQNLVVRAYQATRAALGEPPADGLAVRIELGATPCGGLGSSATATVAGVLAANAQAARPLDERALIELATRLEGHPDNVVPCLLGGLCVAVHDEEGVVWLREEPRDPPAIVIALPEALALSTPAMRAILPETVPFADAVFNLGRAALTALALAGGHHHALRAALQDRLHQPFRGTLIPGFAAVRHAASAAGSLGTVISGSGPTLLSFAPTTAAAAVSDAIETAWSEAGVPSVTRRVSVSATGAQTV